MNTLAFIYTVLLGLRLTRLSHSFSVASTCVQHKNSIDNCFVFSMSEADIQSEGDQSPPQPEVKCPNCDLCDGSGRYVIMTWFYGSQVSSNGINLLLSSTNINNMNIEFLEAFRLFFHGGQSNLTDHVQTSSRMEDNILALGNLWTKLHLGVEILKVKKMMIFKTILFTYWSLGINSSFVSWTAEYKCRKVCFDHRIFWNCQKKFIR